MKPYYEHGGVTIYNGDCREILPQLPPCDVVLTDPPYPYQGNNFKDCINEAIDVFSFYECERWILFWDLFESPPIKLPVVAKHIWHKTNTNRPNNYEMIYEFSAEEKRGSKVFPHCVIFPGLTGCTEANGHPTQKPLSLFRELILLRNLTNIVDPFMGSGTTLEAAKNLGKLAIGIEKEEQYCEIAAKRLSQEVFQF